MTAIGYISDTEEIIIASWSNFQHDGGAAFKLSEGLPVPPALSAKNLPGRRTKVLNVCRIKRIDYHPAESDKHSAPERVLDTKNWLDRNGDFDNPNDNEADWEADSASEIELNNGVRHSETQEQRDVSSALAVPRLIQSTRRSRNKAGNDLMTVGTMETRRSKGIKKK